VDVMRQLGLGPADVRVRLSDRRLLNGHPAASRWPSRTAVARCFYQYLDKLGPP
jgi:hypothetical protein